jgi:hypothetical protein
MSKIMIIVSTSYEIKQHAVFHLPASSIQNPASLISAFSAILHYIRAGRDFLIINDEI